MQYEKDWRPKILSSLSCDIMATMERMHGSFTSYDDDAFKYKPLHSNPLLVVSIQESQMVSPLFRMGD